ncbi:MAG: hypothetical protein KAG97_02375 [Victivallales bacterium]|nr:hypothetical protein [Victivallales bacterium]
MEARSRLLFVCFIVVVTLCVFAPYFIIHAVIASGKVVYHNRVGFPPFSAFVQRRLDHHFGLVERHPLLRSDLPGSPREAELLISIMSWAGADSDEEAERAFAAGIAGLPANLADGLLLQSLRPFDPAAVNNAVSALSTLRVDDKELLFNACLASVGNDEQITRIEWEITRLFAMMIDCPLPAGLTNK